MPRLDRDVDNAQLALSGRIHRYLDLLRVAEPLYIQSPRPPNDASNTFAADLLRTEYPAMAALGVLEETVHPGPAANSSDKVRGAVYTAEPPGSTPVVRRFGRPPVAIPNR